MALSDFLHFWNNHLIKNQTLKYLQIFTLTRHNFQLYFNKSRLFEGNLNYLFGDEMYESSTKKRKLENNPINFRHYLVLPLKVIYYVFV